MVFLCKTTIFSSIATILQSIGWLLDRKKETTAFDFLLSLSRLVYTQVASRCRIQSLIFWSNSSLSTSKSGTQRNGWSFPSSLMMKWYRICAPKGEFNWLSCFVTDSWFRLTRSSSRCLAWKPINSRWTKHLEVTWVYVNKSNLTISKMP